MSDPSRTAKYHANLAADYATEAELAKQLLPTETDNEFANRVGRLRFKAQSHATVANALALCDIAEELWDIKAKL